MFIAIIASNANKSIPTELQKGNVGLEFAPSAGVVGDRSGDGGKNLVEVGSGEAGTEWVDGGSRVACSGAL